MLGLVYHFPSNSGSKQIVKILLPLICNHSKNQSLCIYVQYVNHLHHQRCIHRNHNIERRIQILESAPDNNRHDHDSEAVIHRVTFLSKIFYR